MVDKVPTASAVTVAVIHDSKIAQYHFRRVHGTSYLESAGILLVVGTGMVVGRKRDTSLRFLLKTQGDYARGESPSPTTFVLTTPPSPRTSALLSLSFAALVKCPATMKRNPSRLEGIDVLRMNDLAV